MTIADRDRRSLMLWIYSALNCLCLGWWVASWWKKISSHDKMYSFWNFTNFTGNFSPLWKNKGIFKGFLARAVSTVFTLFKVKLYYKGLIIVLGPRSYNPFIWLLVKYGYQFRMLCSGRRLSEKSPLYCSTMVEFNLRKSVFVFVIIPITEGNAM